MFGFLTSFSFRMLAGLLLLGGLVAYGVFSGSGADADISLEENQQGTEQIAALPLYDTTTLWGSVPVAEESTTTDDALALAATADAPAVPEPERETKPALKSPPPPPPASNPASLCSGVSSNPVCGANGMTYKNECLAKTSGTTVASLGACGDATEEAPPPPATAEEPKPAEEETETPLTGAYPDFITRSISHFGGVLFEGNSLSFSAILRNQGSERAFEKFYGRLYLDIGNNEVFELSFAEQEVHALEKNEEIQLIWKNVWTQMPGTHTIAACADSTKIIQESLEKNNCETLEFTVLGKKDNADLVVTSIGVLPSAPAVGSRPVFSANVFNDGARRASGPWFRLWIDETTRSNTQLTPSEGNGYDRDLDPNEEDSISWSGVWVPGAGDAGEHTYKICADSKEEIIEVNEVDNCKEGSFTVQ